MASTHLVGGKASAVDAPTDLTRSDYLAAFKRAMAEIKSDDVPGLAAGVAFKMFLSLFPALFAAVAIFSMVTTVGDLREWLAEAEGFIPPAALEQIDRPLANLAQGNGGGAGFAAVTGIAAGLWAATSAAVSLMKALSRAYDVEESRAFLRQRLHALALTLALVVALVGVIVLLVLGPQLQAFLLGEIQAPVTWALALLRMVLAFGILVLLFAFVYWLGPDREHPSWVWMSPGALLGVVGWLLVSGGFTLYAQTAGTYNETYGAIAGVVVLLVWLQLSMLVILVGGEVNAEVERERSLRLAVDQGAGFAETAGSAAIVGDRETGAKTLTQAQSAAHNLDPADVPADVPTADLSPPTLADPVPAVPPPAGNASRNRAVPAPALKAGAAVAAAMAAAVFLGFARRRRRG